MTTEAQIEKAFIEKLCELKYSYREDIRDRAALERNFKEKFEELNRVHLSANEFDRLLGQIISPDVFTTAKALREYGSLTRDDGTTLLFTLVNLKDWCKNSYEVVNQLRINTQNSNQRYDVMLLINGIPVVQVELKGLSLTPRVAMKQIVDYKKEAGNGYLNSLLCFMQLFIVSNRSDTWYFANNNAEHLSFDADERFLPLYQFADEKNRKIGVLDDFAEAFLPKCTLGQMISRYMVLVASERKLIMMRPYQIYAVRAIVDCIHENRGNGYIWHTTGSGKTLTSFKTSTLLKDNPDIEKCVFVVDRKDLDRQTREEFNRFQEGCVEENTNTETLVRRLLSTDYADKVIVTTIQKLGLALDDTGKKAYVERLAPLRDKRMVFIFDECHRSQFGENHRAIKAFFPRAQLFGFTGTPIFELNSSYQQFEGREGSMRTTADIFEKQLHAYTITNAIDDGNVLRFQVDYYKASGEATPKPGDPIAKRKVVEAILDKHDGVTARRKFNALLACQSINDAIEYHGLFRTVQAERLAAELDFKPLNVACVFSPPANGNADIRQIQEDLPTEKADNAVEPEKKKAALASIIADYNARYGTNHDLNNFDLYYQDLQKRIKDQQYPNRDLGRDEKVDLVIVVDMLLTGFDSKYLNTLYVDKRLKHHGLIQAFSRTNRVLNATKPFGSILDFRAQDKEVDEAIALFSGEEAKRAKEIWLVDPAPAVITKLKAAVGKLDAFMTSQGLPCAPGEVANLKGDGARAQFINLFKEVQHLRTQLDQYTDLSDKDRKAIEKAMPEETHQAFRGVYLETAQRLKVQKGGGDEGEDEAKELDFEFVLFASALIDYDYIMGLIAKFTQGAPTKQSMSREELIGLIGADAKFMDDREDIAAYIRTLKAGSPLSEAEIKAGYEAFRARKAEEELVAMAARHGLEAASLAAFVDGIMSRMIFDGDDLSGLFAPLELSWKERTKKELALMEELTPYLTRLAGGREISGLAAYEA